MTYSSECAGPALRQLAMEVPQLAMAALLSLETWLLGVTLLATAFWLGRTLGWLW